ncbi:MAG: DegQ family serine endoprotease [Pseudomonadota bacterium]
MKAIIKLFFFFITFIMPVANAALPAKIDGEQLPSLAPMLEQVTPAVVNIATEGSIKQAMNPLFADPFFRRFFGVPDQQMERKTSSLGSGVIVDSKRGLIMTNNHVIANADQITVTMRDGRQLDAEVVGTDPETDVAVIKVDAKDLTAIKLADSDNINVGDFVVAIGNPFGLGQTVTSGIVSALSRGGLGIGGYEDFIQTDASINPGNSGGALVNLRGELIGINTAIFSRSGGNIGIGFAIPINLATNIMEQLIETGEVTRAFLGVSMQDINPELAEAFQLEQKNGAIINQVLESSPAEKAGLKAGDIVLNVDGKTIRNANDLRNRVGLLPVGQTVKLKILRDGKQQTINVTVTQNELITNNPRAENILLQGVTVSDLEQDSPYFGRLAGIKVVNVERGSTAWQGGLRADDIITSANQQDISSVQDFLNVVNQVEAPLLLRIVRGNNAAFLVLKP